LVARERNIWRSVRATRMVRGMRVAGWEFKLEGRLEWRRYRN